MAETQGFRVSASRLFDPEPYADELHWYVSALVELLRVPGVDRPEDREAAVGLFHETYVLGAPRRDCSDVLFSEKEAQQLYMISLHGIFKHLGSGGICTLLKTEPGVAAFLGADLTAADPSGLRSSWDSVNYLSPDIVAQPDAPSWLHRDARLGASASPFWQCLLNVSTHAQLGTEGDASFVCLPGSQDRDWTEEELVSGAAGGPTSAEAAPSEVARILTKAREARSKDWVRVAEFGRAMWRQTDRLQRADVCSGGGVAWDSRLIHSGSLFHVAGRPHARMVKYVFFFSAEQSPAACRKTHELFLKALGADAHGSEGAVLPIAPTTPHRGNCKNSDGRLPVFRVTGKKKAVTEALNALVAHPLVRPFFHLAHMLARSLILLHCDPVAAAALDVTFLASATTRYILGRFGKKAGVGVGDEDRPLTQPMKERLDRLCALHAPSPTRRPTKRPRAPR